MHPIYRERRRTCIHTFQLSNTYNGGVKPPFTPEYKKKRIQPDMRSDDASFLHNNNSNKS